MLKKQLGLQRQVAPLSTILTSSIDLFSSSGVLNIGMSDHYVVFAILGKEKRSVKLNHRYSVNRNFKQFDIDSFDYDLRKGLIF